MQNLSAYRQALAVAAMMLAICLLKGCSKPADSSQRAGRSGVTNLKGELLNSVWENINHLEEYDSEQMMPQVRDRLNQWVQKEQPSTNWREDPLITTLPEKLQKLPVVASLGQSQFTLGDIGFLQQAVWLRDISRGARANDFSRQTQDDNRFDDLDAATRLFDWTVRNIQLQPEGLADQKPRPHSPAEILLLGRGTAAERAWIFILLARQQGIDAVMLAIEDPEHEDHARPWLPAVLTGGQLHLFDTRLGLPILGPDGKSVATLSQAVADDSILSHLDLDAEHPYRVAAADLKHVVAFVEGSPDYLSRRMKLLGSQLAGKRQLVLSVDVSEVGKRATKAGHLAEVRLWPLAYRVWQAHPAATDNEAGDEMAMFQALPSLARGRIRHFQGDYEGPTGAKKFYLACRPSEQQIGAVKLPAELVKRLQAQGQGDPKNLEEILAKQIHLAEQAKQSASFWLGLIAFEEHKYDVAVGDFADRTLKEFPGGTFTNGARYNLARSYEALGKPERAIEIYEADMSPQSQGNKLRARALRAK